VARCASNRIEPLSADAPRSLTPEDLNGSADGDKIGLHQPLMGYPTPGQKQALWWVLA